MSVKHASLFTGAGMALQKDFLKHWTSGCHQACGQDQDQGVGTGRNKHCYYSKSTNKLERLLQWCALQNILMIVSDDHK